VCSIRAELKSEFGLKINDMGFILPILFLFGLAVGSFLNCLIYRFNKGLSPFKGRSFCPQCRHQLAWKDNLPLLSFLFLHGRCRYCHSPISWQYPLVEIATGILTLFIIHYSLFILGDSFLMTVYFLLISYALIVIFVSDLRYGTILDEVILPAMGLAILYSIINHQLSIINFLLSGLGAAGFFLALVAVTRGKGMGMGDVKLAGLMGLVLGWPKIVIALYLAFLTGALVGVILVLIGKKRFGEHLAFGPFLTAALGIMIIWGDQISTWVQSWLLI
jgi:leader peptidase (prepilin peptidase)/N-methyltransferase